MSTLQAETRLVRFGGPYSRAMFHTVDLPESPGPFRRSTDYVSRCGRDAGGSSISTMSAEDAAKVEATGRRITCARCGSK